MGVYVYHLRAPKATIHVEGMLPQTANLLKYAYKDGSWWEEPVWLKRMTTKLENFWEGRETAPFVVVGDKFKTGCQVRSWPEGRTSCYDTPDLAGTHIGYLHKQGKKWIVVSRDKYRELNPGTTRV